MTEGKIVIDAPRMCTGIKEIHFQGVVFPAENLERVSVVFKAGDLPRLHMTAIQGAQQPSLQPLEEACVPPDVVKDSYLLGYFAGLKALSEGMKITGEGK